MLNFRQVKFLLGLMFWPLLLSSQIQVTPGNTAPFTPENIIESVFLGGGVEVTNISFDGDERALGVFDNASSFGLSKGIIMSTGFAMSAAEINDPPSYAGNNTAGTDIQDSDLEAAAGVEVKDIAKYEITFIPTSDTIRFRYIFASEEYPEFVCDTKNDVFGFFIQGPNPAGGDYLMENIALIPDPSDPSGNTFLDLPVTINSVNGGAAAPYTNAELCSPPMGSLEYSQYYNEVSPGSFPIYDAYLDVFTAQALVVPCEEYTIKLAIGDGGDGDFDSAVFLEANSFASTSLSYRIDTESFDRTIAEGCDPAKITISIPKITRVDLPLELSLLPEGTFTNMATPGVDFVGVPDDPFIEAGSRKFDLVIEAFEDNIDDEDEFIYIELKVNSCRTDTLVLPINDHILPIFSMVDTVPFCENIDKVLLTAQSDIVPPVLEEPKFENNQRINFEEDPRTYNSFIEVNGIVPEDQSTRILSRICISQLVTRNLIDIDLHVIDPNGLVLELSTDNGFYEKNSECFEEEIEMDCLDTLQNVCFVLATPDAINAGNPIIGPIIDGNTSYAGFYKPEGDMNIIYTPGNTNNGLWTLTVGVDTPLFQSDIDKGWSYIDGWSIHFHSYYDLIFDWSNSLGDTIDIFNEQITVTNHQSADYYFTVTDTYGCSDSASTHLLALPSPPTPDPLDCITLNSASIQLDWENGNLDNSQYLIYKNNINIAEISETTFIANLLDENTEYEFEVVAKVDGCLSERAITNCTTPPCEGPRPIIDSIQIKSQECASGIGAQVIIFAHDDGSESLTYAIDNFGKDNPTFLGISGGEHEVRVFNELGCVTRDTIFVDEGRRVESQSETQPNQCAGDFDGSITIRPIGDLFPYYIQWDAYINPPTFITFDQCVFNGPDDSCTIDELPSGIYYYTISDNGNCSQRDSIIVGSSPSFRITDILYETSGCIARPTDVEIEVIGGTRPYSYTWDERIRDSIILDVSFGSYPLLIEDSAGCRIDSLVTISGVEPITLDRDTFPVICPNDTSGKLSLEISGGFPPYNINWNNGFSGSEIDSITAGDYTINIIDDQNCIESFDINIQTLDDIPSLISDVVTEAPECFNTPTGTAEFSLNGGVPPFSIQIDSEVNNSDYIFSNLLPGEYEAIITDSLGCLYNLENIIVPEGEELLVNIGEDTIIMFGSDVSIESTSNVIINRIEWEYTPDFGQLLSCEFCHNPIIANITASFTLTIIAIDENGCEIRDSKNIFVNDFYVEVPTAFTPDGDSMNDLLVVFGTPATEVLTFNIYDRWGELIYHDQNFETNNTQRGWDGTFRGQDVDPGTYLWSANFLQMNGEETKQSGSVTLIR